MNDELEKCDHCGLPIEDDQLQSMYDEELFHFDCATEIHEKAYLNSGRLYIYLNPTGE